MSLTEATEWAQEHARMSQGEATEWAEGYVLRRGGSLAPRPVIAETAPPTPSGVTLAAEQVTQLLDRLAVAQAVAVPVRESAEVVAPAPSSYGYPEGWPDKPLHEYSDAERAQYVDQHLLAAAFNRSARPPLDPVDVAAAINGDRR